MKIASSMLAKFVTPKVTRYHSLSAHSVDLKRTAHTKLASRVFFWAMMFAVAVYIESVAFANILHRDVPPLAASIPVCVLVAFGARLAIQMLLSARATNRRLHAHALSRR
ncbi:hypothetical protein [Burkholderia sp. Ac-20365]|uniref:hypothetical protein n=1 Tax=Burkholderia sp. Ac-20365 TaxID=2703897 RepID=UPI00197BD955|nr:hypothetical protein [Burkholderia sp. Ac-20365]MBN3760967.1 hypothetical protein [Burkholderia sp. Ac-20365]